jgi:hypothetical protein
MALATFHNARNGECRPGLAALAQASGLARSTAIVALGTLRERGFVTWAKGADARGQRATNVYTLHGLDGKPKVREPDSGGDKPKVRMVDLGSGVPKSGSRTRSNQEDTGRHGCKKNATSKPAPGMADDGDDCAGKGCLENASRAEASRPATHPLAHAAGGGIDDDSPEGFKKKSSSLGAEIRAIVGGETLAWQSPEAHIARWLAEGATTAHILDAARLCRERLGRAPSSPAYLNGIIAEIRRRASTPRVSGEDYLAAWGIRDLDMPDATEPAIAALRHAAESAASAGGPFASEPSSSLQIATEKKGARRGFEALPPRHPSPRAVDEAISAARARFEALDNPRSPEAWR